MQVDSLVQGLRAEIAFLESENLSLLGELQTMNATLALVQMTLRKLADSLDMESR